jgi:hypothetical protein
MSGYRRIQTGGSDRIVTAVLHAGDPTSPLTGLTTVVLSIWRVNGVAVEWYDFNDATFKAVGWTTLQQVMTALDVTRSPGVYQYLWTTASITNPNANDSYFYRVTDTSLQARNIPQEGMLDVGQYPDKLDALISSRAVAGDAMALTPAERLAVDAELSGVHGAGSWEGSTAAAVATAVWDEALPGTHGAGSAGKIVGDDLDAKVSTRATQAQILSDATPFPGADIDALISSRASATALAAVQADTDDIQTRLPTALVSGRMDSSVEAMAANVLTAAAIATDAIDADALAADAIAEIQSGLATAIALAAVQADTDDIQTRLPATLNGGRMRSHVEAMDNDVIGAAQIAAGAIGVSEAPLLANLDDTISSRAAPGDAMTLTPAERVDIDIELSGVHGPGNWEGGGGGSSKSIVVMVDEDLGVLG